MAEATDQEAHEDRARQQAQAQIDGLRETLDELDAAVTREEENAAIDRLHGCAVGASVRSPWVRLTTYCEDAEGLQPREYKITLCTGGPAVQLRGELRDGEPHSAKIEYRDGCERWSTYPFPPETTRELIRAARHILGPIGI